MARVEVTFEMNVPTEDVDGKPISPTQEQVRQWLEFELGYNGTLSAGNPLYTNSLEPDQVQVEFTEDDEDYGEIEPATPDTPTGEPA